MPLNSQISVNDTIRLTGTFETSGVKIDPVTITCKVISPAGTQTSYTYVANQVKRSDTGIYYLDIQVTASGWWLYRFEGVSSGVYGNEDSSFYVNPTSFT